MTNRKRKGGPRKFVMDYRPVHHLQCVALCGRLPNYGFVGFLSFFSCLIVMEVVAYLMLRIVVGVPIIKLNYKLV